MVASVATSNGGAVVALLVSLAVLDRQRLFLVSLAALDRHRLFLVSLAVLDLERLCFSLRPAAATCTRHASRCEVTSTRFSFCHE